MCLHFLPFHLPFQIQIFGYIWLRFLTIPASQTVSSSLIPDSEYCMCKNEEMLKGVDAKGAKDPLLLFFIFFTA